MSKYKAKQTVVDDIQFDSRLESEYYIHLKEKEFKGEIQGFRLQPLFTLQEGFRKNGKWIRPILYKADFEIMHNDGSIEVVDVEGFVTKDFAIKKKMFEKNYPHTLTLVKYVKKFGGWVSEEEYKKRKKEEKKKINV